LHLIYLYIYIYIYYKLTLFLIKWDFRHPSNNIVRQKKRPSKIRPQETKFHVFLSPKIRNIVGNLVLRILNSLLL